MLYCCFGSQGVEVSLMTLSHALSRPPEGASLEVKAMGINTASQGLHLHQWRGLERPSQSGGHVHRCNRAMSASTRGVTRLHNFGAQEGYLGLLSPRRHRKTVQVCSSTLIEFNQKGKLLLMHFLILANAVGCHWTIRERPANARSGDVMVMSH